MPDRQLAVVEESSYSPRMVMTAKEALDEVMALQAFVKAVMVPEVDFGKIPGTQKPTLLKPGAEKLCELYGFAPHISVVIRIEDWQNGFFHYECKCTLVNKRTDKVEAEGIGSCNSREKRYADRWVFEQEIPFGLSTDNLPCREYTNKNGGRFSKYLVPNDDPYSLVNTILKMAKKRALVDATITATRSSGMFTQDIEDWVNPEAEDERPVSTQANKPSQNKRQTARKLDVTQATLTKQEADEFKALAERLGKWPEIKALLEKHALNLDEIPHETYKTWKQKMEEMATAELEKEANQEEEEEALSD